MIESCEIAGSSDSSIQNARVNDMNIIFNAADIKAVYANGKKAEQLYRKYLEPVTNRSIVGLPSTSPANAAFSIDRLADCWKRITEV